MRLLVVEDDDEMRALMERGLAAEGYRVTAVENGVEALIALGDQAFDLAVVDVMMPGMSGFELARRIREREDPVRILLVTARDAVDDRVFGLDAGADDYLTKPFAFAELTARLRALGRRESAGAPRTIEVGDVAIDSEARRILIKGQRVAVSPTEFALLRLLARSVGTVVDRPKILEEVWDGSQHVDPNVVEQYISYLRKKLTSHEATVAISTVRGRGYRLDLLGA
ncbi:DNA-binding response OmpR family regulator [Curtobacterium flaccumfaciens]|jgi:two-component system OmpR family response regulator|uniref:DNA-binding response OmpR family regulator n=1 Tax=Curtobacterium flaccumfaciens TaxID=2035 RepID=A0A4R6DML2_9MICO|nr:MULTISPECIES: response regulator transcription factor [Curtobacterium]AOX64773.1 DNA-binding response regulator [Curtobacterium sp. BH-2-1-1]MCC8906779.1 response regulator transcription factor [Curtobacterium sp. GD1]MCT9620597.1 response regulator transcription factor [Curtobacterium sp. C2H10]MDR6170988.1 two-component system OmpR family response regulator [Curtobacterium sp. SORGH_AS_0776]MDR6573947.1 DNA-binding response OmpR family regulator [Curtobacterium sp. 320]